jgi:hypothetical protein
MVSGRGLGREPVIDVAMRGLAVGASGSAGLGAGAESFGKDGLDSARAAAAFGAAAKAAIDLLGVARKLLSGSDGIADIVGAEHVAGTDNHENGKALRVMRRAIEILNSAAACKRKSRPFERFQSDARDRLESV